MVNVMVNVMVRRMRMLLGAVNLAVLLGIPVWAVLNVDVDATRRRPVRQELPWGYIEYGNNEVAIVSTVDDPPALRLGATVGGSLGKVSFDVIRPDGVPEELVLVQGKVDERLRGTNFLGGEVTLHLRRPGVDNDAAMVPILTMRYDGIALHVPVTMVGEPRRTDPVR